MPVCRFDFQGTTHSIETTPQGFVRVNANLTRIGIFTYRQDGKTIQELRSPEEVFRPESLKSIAGAPVTDLHPNEIGEQAFITPENAQKLAIGFAGEDIKQDGDFIIAKLTITDAKAIEALKAGTRKEISLSYTCDIEQRPGTFDGARYDAIQRNIVVNHIALGPPGWGRAGPEVSIKLDEKEKSLSDTTLIKIGDVEFEVPRQVAQALLAELQRKDEAVEKVQGRLDALAIELDKEREKRKALEDPKATEEHIQQRLKLLTQCQKILGDIRADSKTDRELKELVVKKDNAAIDLSQKADAYIEGMFEAALAYHNRINSSLAEAHVALSPPLANRIDAKDIAVKWQLEAREMWKRPLATTRN